MKKLNLFSINKYLLLLVAGTLLLTSCDEQPDLTVSSKDWSISGDQYVIKLTVKNIGDAESGNALVYINYIDPTPPTGINEIRIQKSEELPNLDAGEEFDFIKYIPLRDIHAKEIKKIIVLVDPKEMVDEKNEDNNEASWIWDDGL